MTPSLILIRDGKKFMWDGQVYSTREEASKVEESYLRDKFEVCVNETEGQFVVYTRRLVSQAAVVQ